MLAKGDLRLLEDQGRFVLERVRPEVEDYVGLSMDEGEFRWLVFMAAPAMANAHLPREQETEPPAKPLTTPFDEPEVNPGQEAMDL